MPATYNHSEASKQMILVSSRSLVHRLDADCGSVHGAAHTVPVTLAQITVHHLAHCRTCWPTGLPRY